jgi:hypothetical protein
VKAGKYRPFKGGLYQVQGRARLTETGEPPVAEAFHESKNFLWIRAVSARAFLSKLEKWRNLQKTMEPA